MITSKIRLFCLVGIWLAAGAWGCDGNGGDAESDGGSDGDTDTDGDTDSDSDTESDGGSDGDTDTDGDTDSDSDTDSDGDVDNPLDPGDGWSPDGKWGAEGDMDDWGGGDSDGDGDVDGDTDSDSDSDTDTDDGDAGSDDAGGVSDAGRDGGEADAGKKFFPRDGDIEIPEPKTLYLSADDSNSQSSPVLVRAMIESGRLVTPGKIRIWEFFNYYDFSYATPQDDSPLSVTQQLRPYDFEGGLYALQIGVQGRHLKNTTRRPMNITLILDTSGSMSGSPIQLLRDSCRAIAGSLRGGDRISMVTWDTSQTIPLDSLVVDGPDDPRLIAEIDKLSAGGGTNLNAGLIRGYQLARKNFMEGGLNRVVLVSDGGANVGVTDEQLIAKESEGAEDEAIYMVGVGVGDAGYYNDVLMNAVTDLGKGASIYIDSTQEAEKMFGERFLANMEVVALDVQVEMTLPPFFDIDKFFGEEYSEEPNEVEPQHLGANDAMIYQQLIKTTQPTMVRANDTIDLRVTYTDALSGEEGSVSLTSELQELVDGPSDELRKGDAIVVYAQTLGFTTLLVEDEEIERAHEECQNGIDIVADSAEALEDSDLEEILSLLTQHCSNLPN